jgi:hypothetical protein
MADKYKIIEEETSGIFDQHEVDITGLSNGIDRYMKETCLELLEYMANNNVDCLNGGIGDPVVKKSFYFKGEWIDKETLFENFL